MDHAQWKAVQAPQAPPAGRGYSGPWKWSALPWAASRTADVERLASEASALLSEVVTSDLPSVRTAVEQYGYDVVEVEEAKRRFLRTRAGVILAILAMAHVVPLMLLSEVSAPVLSRFAMDSYGSSDAILILQVFWGALLGCMGLGLLLWCTQRPLLRALAFTWLGLASLASAAAGIVLVDVPAPISVGLIEASIALAALLILGAARPMARLEAQFPHILLLRDLTSVWHDLQDPSGWLDFTRRGESARRIKALEGLANRDFWRILAPGDAASKKWARERGQEIARVLRGLAEGVTWPGGGDREHVTREIGRMCSCIVEAKLKDITTESSTPRPAVLPVRAVFAHVFLTTIPLASLVVLKLAGISIKFEPYVAFIAITWLFLGLLVAVDPLIERRLPTIRTIFHLVGSKPE